MKKVLTIAAVFVVLAAGGWLAYAQTKDKPTQQTQNTNQQNNTAPTDPSEGGKYLVIQEWGVRFLLPEALRNMVSYSAPAQITDEDNISFETTKILLSSQRVGGICDLVDSSVGKAISTNLMLIKVGKGSSFNLNRYKGYVQANILTTTEDAFHLNYTEPSCADEATMNFINQLEEGVVELDSYQL